jgi:putative MFS transporter
MSNIAARIERIPFNRFHWRLLIIGGLGYAFDALDGAVMAFVLPSLAKLWSLTPIEIGFTGSVGFVGVFVGAMSAGLLGDAIGRKAVMMYSLVFYGLATIASAFCQDYWLFVACRTIVGAGLGAESAIIAPFLSEFVPSHVRGRFVGSLSGFFSFGFVGAALIGYLIVPLSDQAWRWVIVGTAAPIVMLIWWRRALPESPRWLASVGRTAEAQVIVDDMEARARREGHVLKEALQLPEAPSQPAFKSSSFGKLAVLWSAPLRRVTSMAWIMWIAITFSYYAFFTWIPSLLIANGMTVTRSFGFSLAMYVAQVPGYFSAAWMNEKIGRQWTIILYMLFGGAAALGMGFARSDNSIMIAGIFLSFFMNGTYAGVYAYTPELFPTEVRATGMGTSSAIGRIGGMISPVTVGWLYPTVGFAGVFGVTTAVLVAGALAILIFGVNTKNRSLEAITADEVHAEEAA